MVNKYVFYENMEVLHLFLRHNYVSLLQFGTDFTGNSYFLDGAKLTLELRYQNFGDTYIMQLILGNSLQFFKNLHKL